MLHQGISVIAATVALVSPSPASSIVASQPPSTALVSPNIFTFLDTIIWGAVVVIIAFFLKQTIIRMSELSVEETKVRSELSDEETKVRSGVASEATAGKSLKQ